MTSELEILAGSVHMHITIQTLEKSWRTVAEKEPTSCTSFITDHDMSSCLGVENIVHSRLHRGGRQSPNTF